MRGAVLRGPVRRPTSGGGSPSWPNEPAGWTLIADTTWEAADLGAWASGTRDGWSIKFVDATRDAAIETISDGVIGESRALTHVYPIDHTGGGGGEPWLAVGGTYRSLYLGMYVRLSANWYGHGPSGINKLAYIKTEDASFSAMWVEYRAAGASAPLEPYMVNQLVGGSGSGITTGLTSGYPVRGNWARVEVRLDLDAPRRVRYWVDGTLWIDDTTFTGAAAGRINEVTLSGIMGGVGASANPEIQRMQYDRVRILAN
jgi:hypothetical protein